MRPGSPHVWDHGLVDEQLGVARFHDGGKVPEDLAAAVVGPVVEDVFEKVCARTCG